MKKNLKTIIVGLLLLSTLFLMVGCGSKPDESIKGFFDAVKKQDLNTASSYIKKDGKETFKYQNPDQEKLVKSVFSKLDYKIISSSQNGDTATVKVTVTSLDLPNIFAKSIKELLPTLMASALSQDGAKQDKSQVQKSVMQYMINAMNNSKAPKTNTDVNIALVKQDKKWLIKPDDDLLNALTGNLSKAMGVLGKQ